MDLNYVKCNTCGREAVTRISGGIATFPTPCLCGGSSFSALLTGLSEPEGTAALRKDSELLAWVLAHPETAAECLEDAAAGDGTARGNLESRREALAGRIGAA